MDSNQPPLFSFLHLCSLFQVCNWVLSRTFAWIQIPWAFVLHTEVIAFAVWLLNVIFSCLALNLGFEYFLRAAGNASEEALDRLPTSATCMNLLKLPPYRRFVSFYYLSSWSILYCSEPYNFTLNPIILLWTWYYLFYSGVVARVK